MKIMHILCTVKLSGAEQVALDILSLLKDENEVYYVSPDGEIRDCVTSRGVNFIPCDTDSIKELKRIYNEIKPDIVHAHDPRMSFKCAIAGLPFVSHLHCNCHWMKKICPNSLALLYAMKKAKAVITVSPSIKNEYVFSGVMKNNHYMIYNAVDANKVIRMAQEPFEGEYDLIFVGRAVREKRPLMFLDAVKKATEIRPSIKAVMVSYGELMDDVREKLEGEHMSNVILCDFQLNPYRIMNKAKICVVTSSMEGFGLVAIESMVLSKPVVSTAVGGLCDIVDSSCGALCDSAEEMAEAVISLLDDSQKYGDAAAGAAEKAKGFTDIGFYKSQILEVYKSVLR